MSALDRELDLVLGLIRRCGDVALRIQAGGDETLQTTAKTEDQSPVTQADLAVEEAIVEALREHFPDDAILAEESAAAANWRAHERVWMIDPVDGTKDFASGDNSWAIHIGLAIAGRPALGVVHEPGHDRTNWAIDDGRERLCRYQVGRDGPIHEVASAGPNPTPKLRLVTSKSHRSERLDALMERLGIGADETLRTPSTGVKISMVARGEVGFYAHPTIGTKLWDSCAPEAILNAAGGRVTDMRGQPLTYAGPGYKNDLGLLASGRGFDHDALVESLRPLVDAWFGPG